MKLLLLNFQFIIMICLVNNLFSQNSKIPIRFWGLQDISGIIGAEGEYKLQEINYNSSISDKLESSFIKGQFLLNTKSYFYHPNLVYLETEAEYNPGTQKDKYLVLPNRSSINTGERVRGLITFLRTQPVIVSCNANYSHLYSNREYSTNLESFNTGFGGGIRLRVSKVPISISYRNEKIDQREQQTNRNYLTYRENLNANSEFSLSQSDKNRIVFNYDDFDRKYYSSSRIRAKISTINFNSNVNFDTNYVNRLNTNINYSINNGNTNYERVLVNENLNLELQNNFIYSGNYSYFNFAQQDISTKQHTIVNRIEHQLYESLKSNIFYEYTNSDNTFSEEIIKTGGIGISYTKKIPGGVLNLSYNFSKRNLNNNNLSPNIIIVNEEKTLNDDQIVLLNNPYIDINSIKVTDESNTIVYQEFLDFIIIERGSFFEIQRILGGLIGNGETVYIDYVAEAQPSFEFAINSNRFNSSISLFNNQLEIYFRLNENNYDNIIGRDATILKSISQRILGTKINFNFFSVGAEFDDYNSNIIPYEAMRYFLTLSARCSNNFSTSVTGNLKFIELIDENVKQKFHDLAGRLIYNFSRITNFNLEASYRFQDGRGLDLDLAILRGELTTQYRSIYFTLGIEGYNRTYIGENRNYWGSYIRIERKF